MKIVIAGAGEVGSHLAKLLADENNDIYIIDEELSRLQKLDSFNLMSILGKPRAFKTLNNPTMRNADLFIAVTPFEADNILACMLAKSIFKKVRTVARIDNYEFLTPQSRALFKEKGVDELIYPEYLAGEAMIDGLEHTWARSWFELCSGELIVIGVKMRNRSSRLVDAFLHDLPKFHSGNLHVSAIKRGKTTIIPSGDECIKLNDIVYFVTTKDHVDALRELSGKEQIDVQNVMIVGGSRNAIQLVYLSEGKYKFTIIEKDEKRCHYLAEKFDDENVSIIHGDGGDIDLLLAEGIKECEAFISLTGSSETNMIACLMAKELGCKKTIAEVESIQFISEADRLNIGTVINKKLLASSKIFQMLLDSDEENAKCLTLKDAEVAELVAKPNTKITKNIVSKLDLPRDRMTIAGLTRNGVGMIVTGQTQIEPGDHVVVFFLKGSFSKVESLFK